MSSIPPNIDAFIPGFPRTCNCDCHRSSWNSVNPPICRCDCKIKGVQGNAFMPGTGVGQLGMHTDSSYGTGQLLPEDKQKPLPAKMWKPRPFKCPICKGNGNKEFQGQIAQCHGCNGKGWVTV